MNPKPATHSLHLNQTSSLFSSLWRLKRFLWRDLRSSALGLMAVALVLSVAAVSAVGLLADRVEQGLLGDAQSSLGADRILISGQPIRPEWLDLAKRLGLKAELGSQFPSTVVAGPKGDRLSLVSVKSVGPSHPMRGQLLLETGPAGSLERGQAWADPQLLTRLGLQVGDRVQLGAIQLTLAGQIQLESDRGMNFLAFSPRLMIRHDDLAATGLIQPGSRVSYRLLLTGSGPALQAFDAAAAELKQPGERFETVSNGRPELKAALERAQGFLSVTSMMAILTATAALFLAARQLSQDQRPRFAVMKALGAGRSVLLAYWTAVLMVLVLIAGSLGLLLGLGIQTLLSQALGQLMALPLQSDWQPSLLPLVQAVVLGLGMVLGFAWPVVLQALKVPALASLRPEQPRAQPMADWRLGLRSRLLMGLAFLLGLMGLLTVSSGRVDIAALVTLVFAGLGALFYVLLRLAFYGLGQVLPSALPQSWLRARPGIRLQVGWALMSLRRNLLRRGPSLAAQSLGLSMALAALFLLSFLQTDLVGAWSRTIPPDAPNRFVLNIQPDEEQAVRERIAQYTGQTPSLAPVVRGRLVAINGQTVSPEQAKDDRARGFLDREQNLSAAEAIPAYNEIIAGQALDPRGAEVSVEQGFAKSLGIRLGDELRFDIVGEPVVAKVTSIRKLRWDTMAVNFFLLISPALVEGQARTAITSFFVAPEQSAALGQALLAEHPGLTLVETDAIVRQVRGVLEKVVAAVQGLFVFSLLAGALVVWASQLSTRAERSREATLLRAFGGQRRQLILAQVLELWVTGGLAGLMAVITAQLTASLLANALFELSVPWRLSPLVYGLLVGGLITFLAGLWTLRRVLRTPVMAVLRSGV